MRKVATAGLEARVSKVEDLRAAIPAKSLMNEFLNVPGVDLQSVDNAIKYLSNLFGVKVVATIEHLEEGMKMFFEIKVPEDKYESYKQKRSRALREMREFYPSFAPHTAISIRLLSA